MQRANDVICMIAKVSSYNDKLAILRQHGNSESLREILKFIYNPYCKTGISSAKLSKALDYPVTNTSITWQEAIKYFQKNQTGSDIDLVFARNFIASNPGCEGLAIAMVTQNLKIGITSTSLNAVYGKDFIPKVGCMLGTLFGDVGPSKTSWPCIVTEKLDGIRRVLIKENGVCRLYSRSGHEDTGLIEIIEDAKHLPDNMVYDGELLAKGTFKDCIAQRQASNSIANSKGIKTGLTFNVFDMIPVDEFYTGKSKETALKRKIRLGATLMDESIQILDENYAQLIAAFGIHQELKCIRPVPILGLVDNIQQVEPIVEEIWKNGGEGVMLNTSIGLYEIKRSKQLLKIKHTEEHVLEVVNVLEGSGKYEDSMGALVVKYKDAFLGVGSGFTDAQRQDIWNNQSKYIGRKVEIETFGESKNAAGGISLNCPIFKRFVGDE